MSGIIPLFFLMIESRIQVTYGVVDRLAVPLLLGTTFIDKSLKSVHSAERMIVP